MNHRKPSLDIYHPVRNIGKGEVDALKEELIDDAGGETYATPEILSKLLRPARLLRAEVLIHSELLKFHDYIGLGEVSEEHIDELAEYLGGVLPDFSHHEVIDTPTLPVHRDPLGEGYVLSIAGSTEVMQERVLVKAALANYYRLPRTPTHVWRDDERTTRAWVARSVEPLSNDLLERLEAILLQKPDLLPDRAEMSGVLIKPNPFRTGPRDE
jgi:hypothetical protein